jgi:DNA-binding LacI/PurR family transcriptional regulator
MTQGSESGEVTGGAASAGRGKPPGLKEIAAYLNLSPATVSMVVNDAPIAKSLSAETRARVLAATKKFNYRPNLVARALSKRESRTIGVLAPEAGDGHFTRVMRGVEAALVDAGYMYFTVSHMGREDRIRESPSALLQRGVDGLLFVNTPVYEHPGVPTVCVSHRCALQGVTSVVADQQEGIDAAMRHLLELGHHRILLVRGQQWSADAQDRFACMVAAARRLGLPTSPELQMTMGADELTPELAFRAFAEVFATRPQFTAICCFNDLAAIGAVRAMTDAGLACPHDISVVGVDDISTTAFLTPRLTTASQPLEEMGAAAVQHLLGRLRAPHADAPQDLVFPMTLRVRESTGPAARSSIMAPASPVSISRAGANRARIPAQGR